MRSQWKRFHAFANVFEKMRSLSFDRLPSPIGDGHCAKGVSGPHFRTGRACRSARPIGSEADVFAAAGPLMENARPFFTALRSAAAPTRAPQDAPEPDDYPPRTR